MGDPRKSVIFRCCALAAAEAASAPILADSSIRSDVVVVVVDPLVLEVDPDLVLFSDRDRELDLDLVPLLLLAILSAAAFGLPFSILTDAPARVPWLPKQLPRL